MPLEDRVPSIALLEIRKLARKLVPVGFSKWSIGELRFRDVTHFEYELYSRKNR